MKKKTNTRRDKRKAVRQLERAIATLVAVCEAALLREDIADGELGDVLREAVAKFGGVK